MALSAVWAQNPTDELWKWHFERGEALYRSVKYIEAYEEMRKAGLNRSEMDEVRQREIDY